MIVSAAATKALTLAELLDGMAVEEGGAGGRDPPEGRPRPRGLSGRDPRPVEVGRIRDLRGGGMGAVGKFGNGGQEEALLSVVVVAAMSFF